MLYSAFSFKNGATTFFDALSMEAAKDYVAAHFTGGKYEIQCLDNQREVIDCRENQSADGTLNTLQM